MAQISYAPGGLPAVVMTFADKTIGPTTSLSKVSTQPVTQGTLPPSQAAAYPQFNIVGRSADVGEIADCLNQLVARIEALEAVLGQNPAQYSITPT
jgi:hypothetical protein